jgi:hypothetical protein
MQGKTYYKTETQCRVSMEVQKQHMQNVIKQADKGEATVLEGTCIDANIKTTSGRAI